MPARNATYATIVFRGSLLLAVLVCGTIALTPLVMLLPGPSWPVRLANIPRTLTAVWRLSHRSAFAVYILPFIGLLICIAASTCSIAAIDWDLRRKLVGGAFGLLTMLTVAIALLLGALPYIATALLPMGYALYVARK